jgi:hypothetical protein
MEFSPGPDSSGFMDEYARQLNSLAAGIASHRAPRPQAPEKSRPAGDRPRRDPR